MDKRLLIGEGGFIKETAEDVDNVLEAIKKEVNITKNYAPMLFYVSYRGNTEAVRVLLERGVDVHSWGDAALRVAAMNGYTEIVKLLLEGGANVHSDDDRALCLASIWGHTETVKVLLEHGADAHARNDEAIRQASSSGHTEIVELLKTSYDNSGQGNKND